MQRRWIGAALTIAVLAALLSYLAWTESSGARGETADAADPHTVRLDQLTARVERLEAELARMRVRRSAALGGGEGGPPRPGMSMAPAVAPLAQGAQGEELPEMGGDGDAARIARRVQRLSQIAKLSESQVEAVSNAFETERSKLTALRQSAGEAPDGQARAQMQMIRRNTDRTLEGILDEQQYAAYQAMRRRGRHGARQARGMPRASADAPDRAASAPAD